MAQDGRTETQLTDTTQRHKTPYINVSTPHQKQKGISFLNHPACPSLLSNFHFMSHEINDCWADTKLHLYTLPTVFVRMASN